MQIKVFHEYILEKFKEKSIDITGQFLLSRKDARNILAVYHIPMTHQCRFLNEMEQLGMISRKSKRSITILK